jgi:hypothetical protein
MRIERKKFQSFISGTGTGENGTQNQWISGGLVYWSGTGLTFNITPAVYTIQGTTYQTTVETSVTLDTADGTYSRFDNIGLDDTEDAFKVTGTPSANPLHPSEDPAEQLHRTFVEVEAGATEPNVTQEWIYRENTEWTTSTNAPGTRVDFDDTADPYAGTKAIDVTDPLNGEYLRFTRGSVIDLAGQDIVLMRVKSKSAAAAFTSRIRFRWANGSSWRASLTINDGQFGLVSTTNDYLVLAIPISTFDFGKNSKEVDGFEIRFLGGNWGGFYIDDIQLQSGVGQVPTTCCTWEEVLAAGPRTGQQQAITDLYNAGNSGAALTLDFNNGNNQYLTLTANCTLTFTHGESGTGYSLMIKQDGTGTRLITWPSDVIWPLATAPTLSETAGYVDIISLKYNGVDAKYHGVYVTQYDAT